METSVQKSTKTSMLSRIIAFCSIYKNKNKTNQSEKFSWLMTKKKKALFQKYAEKAKIYLEFGAGGSTNTALNLALEKIYSVESSEAWINILIEKHKLISESKQSGRLNFFHADIGPVKFLGYPVVSKKDKSPDRFLRFSQGIFEKYPEAASADVILVDGRFRAACFLYSLLKVKDDAVLMFHDFWNRRHYHAVLKYIDVIDRANSLMVCRKKNNVSNDEILNEYEKFKFDPR
ncbi:MAG: hypothetical protein FWD13_06110 [Treponema sp.]|nr:hypothetical protein [Treponema sp.]